MIGAKLQCGPMREYMTITLGLMGRFAISLASGRDRHRLVTGGSAGGCALTTCVVLVVEDDELVLAGLQLFIEGLGHEVVAASSLSEALVRMNGRARPDVVVVDYRLRDHETGLMVVDAVRQRYGEEVNAVMLTGETGADRLAELSRRGIPVMHKPVRPERLSHVVEDYCAKAGRRTRRRRSRSSREASRLAPSRRAT
jgi:CheY-like chemotaxis protein